MSEDSSSLSSVRREEVPRELGLYRECLATYLNWTRNQLWTLRDTSEQNEPDRHRLQQLLLKIDALSPWCLRMDLINAIVYALDLEEGIGAIHNELTYLWVTSHGEDQSFPALSAKFPHAEQKIFKKAIIDYIANNRVHYEAAARLEGKEAMWFMDEVQEVLYVPSQLNSELIILLQEVDRFLQNPSCEMRHDPSREKLIRLLHEVAHASHMLPSSHYLHVAGLKPDTCILEADCGEAYTYRARWKERNIAIRVVKYASDEEQQKIYHEILIREIMVWRQLKHDNILYYEGVLHPGEVPEDFPVAHRDMPWIVSEWHPRGNILKYIHDTQPTPLQIIDLIIGIADALNYLHRYSPPVIHGDVKPGNILVSDTGKALLCDFGRAHFRHRPQRAQSHPSPGGTPGYMAPELFSTPENMRTTEATDIYSFAMLIYRVVSGSHPFPTDLDETMMIKVAVGERPSKPTAGLFADSRGDELFQLVTEMWRHEPNLRPNIEQVQKQLGDIRSMYI